MGGEQQRKQEGPRGSLKKLMLVWTKEGTEGRQRRRAKHPHQWKEVRASKEESGMIFEAAGTCASCLWDDSACDSWDMCSVFFSS